jgi:small subunit ribosomal protein S8
MSDPIADMFTRIRNAQSAEKVEVNIPASKMKQNIAKLLEQEGYINGFAMSELDGKPAIKIQLRYYQGKPVIETLQRISRPGLRIYKGTTDIPNVDGGLGVAIVSTSKGIMTDRAARKEGVGGEVVGYVA